MKKSALIAALVLVASPVAAQQQPLDAGGTTNNSSLPNTGVFCIEEITATFCNVATSPSHSGYGSATGGGAGSNTSSIPICPEFPPANELCN
jgi:hypothetical protein